MLHPIDSIIQVVDSSTLPSDSREKLLIYDVDKKNFLSKKPVFVLWNRNIQYYIVTLNKKVKGNTIACTWANNLRDIHININIKYEIKCPPNSERLLVTSLQNGDNFGEALEQLIRDWVEEFYDEYTAMSVDVILMYFKQVLNGASIKQRLELFLQRQIKEYTGLIPQIALHLDNENSLEPLEIIALEPIEIRLKDYDEKIALRYEVVLNVLESEKIYAILNFGKKHEIEELIVKLMKSHLLTNISLHDFCYNIEALVKKELEGLINEQIITYGREVGALVIKSDDIEVLKPDNILLFEEEIPCNVEGYSSSIIVDNKIGLSIKDLGKLKAKKVESPKEWIIHQLKDVVQKEVVSFETYTDILLDLMTSENASKFEALINKKLVAQAASIGYDLKHEAKIRTDFSLPKATEPIHHEISCTVEDYSEPITLVHKVAFHIQDVKKYIYSNIENLPEWIVYNLEVIVKNILSFKTFAAIAVESTKDHNSENTYKKDITRKIEEKAMSIGCTVQQLLIEPRLKPLEWLEDFTIDFEQEFPTKEDGIPIRLGVSVEGHVENLEELPNKYLKPNADITLPIQAEVTKLIGGIFKKTPSERAYLEFYAEKDGVESVAQEIKNAISNTLQKNFDIYKPNIILRTLDTPIVLRYKELRRSEGKFQIQLLPSVGKNVQKLIFNGTYSIVGISNWNTFKTKDYNKEETLQKISNHLQNVIEKRLRLANIQSLISNNLHEVFNLEERVIIFSQQQITKHYGLLIDITYFDRENTEQEKQNLLTVANTTALRGEIDRKNIKDLLEEQYKAIPKLQEEKRILKNRKERGTANKKEKERLKEIKKILDEYSSKISSETEQDSEDDNAKLLENNTVNNLFKTSTNLKELNQHQTDEEE